MELDKDAVFDFFKSVAETADEKLHTASGYQTRGAILIAQGTAELISGATLALELPLHGLLLMIDGNKKLAYGQQQYIIGTILAKKIPTKSSKGIYNYESPTKGYNAALADFNAINPSNVEQDTKNAKTFIGELMDGVRINVREYSSRSSGGGPTLEIQIKKNIAIKIRYGP
jgi:hypothetical protein